MIRELRMYWAVRTQIARMKELSHMKFSASVLISMVTTIALAVVQISDIAPAGWKVPLTMALIILEATKGLANHWVNPDGTPAAVAYDPKTEILTPPDMERRR